jgi:hypothetical protein
MPHLDPLGRLHLQRQHHRYGRTPDLQWQQHAGRINRLEQGQAHLHRQQHPERQSRSQERHGTVTGTNAHTSGSILLGNLNNGVLKLLDNARLSCTSNFRVGGAGNSHGALYIDGGAFSNSQAAGENNVNIGCENNAYGYLRMTGGSLNAGRLQTGGYSGGTACGTGVVRIEGGTLTFPDWIILGRRVGGKSAVTLDGGTFTHGASGEFAFCRNGGDCEVNVTGGALNNPSAAITFHNLDTGAGTGIVNLCAGRLTTRNFYNKTSYTVNRRCLPDVRWRHAGRKRRLQHVCAVDMTRGLCVRRLRNLRRRRRHRHRRQIRRDPGRHPQTDRTKRRAIALAAQGSGYIGDRTW